MTTAVADIDGDGDLTLHCQLPHDDYSRSAEYQNAVNPVNGEYLIVRVNDRGDRADLVGRFTLDANRKIVEHGEVDVLYRNEGKGRFVPLSFTDGTFRRRWKAVAYGAV